jgi:hypothetical protein
MRKDDGVWRGGWAHGNTRDRADGEYGSGWTFRDAIVGIGTAVQLLSFRAKKKQKAVNMERCKPFNSIEGRSAFMSGTLQTFQNRSSQIFQFIEKSKHDNWICLL